MNGNGTQNGQAGHGKQNKQRRKLVSNIIVMTLDQKPLHDQSAHFYSKPLRFRVYPGMRIKIERLAKKHGLSTNQVARILLDYGMQALETLDK